MDNNFAENAIRSFVGVKASANLYSLIETAKANGLEPYAYLRILFAELPKATTVEEIEVLFREILISVCLNKIFQVR